MLEIYFPCIVRLLTMLTLADFPPGSFRTTLKMGVGGGGGGGGRTIIEIEDQIRSTHTAV